MTDITTRFKELRHEAKATSEPFVDTLLFYFYEYKEDFTLKEIATIFVETYSKIAYDLAEEMSKDEYNL